MTYSPGPPGNSGYSTGPYGAPPARYPANTPTAEPGPSKLPQYLNIVVVVSGIAAYVAAFGPVFTASANLGPFSVEATSTGGILLTLASVLAALLAAIGLLPKTKNYPTVVAVLAVLGVLAVIEQIVNRPQTAAIGWALWVVLAFVLLQAVAAVLVLLFETGVLAPPAPRQRYEAGYGSYGGYGGYGAPGGYYGQTPPMVPPAGQRPGYQSYGRGYPQGSAPVAGYEPSASPADSQDGPPTPPTGFPSFNPPPPAGSGQHHVPEPEPGISEGTSSREAGGPPPSGSTSS